MPADFFCTSDVEIFSNENQGEVILVWPFCNFTASASKTPKYFLKALLDYPSITSGLRSSSFDFSKYSAIQLIFATTFLAPKSDSLALADLEASKVHWEISTTSLILFALKMSIIFPYPNSCSRRKLFSSPRILPMIVLLCLELGLVKVGINSLYFNHQISKVVVDEVFLKILQNFGIIGDSIEFCYFPQWRTKGTKGVK